MSTITFQLPRFSINIWLGRSQIEALIRQVPYSTMLQQMVEESQLENFVESWKRYTSCNNIIVDPSKQNMLFWSGTTHMTAAVWSDIFQLKLCPLYQCMMASSACHGKSWHLYSLCLCPSLFPNSTSPTTSNTRQTPHCHG